MRIFYEEWQCLSIGSPLANQLQQLENKIEEGIEIGEKIAAKSRKPICPTITVSDSWTKNKPN